MKVALCLAETESHGIGWKGRLPWDLKEDLAYFSRLTRGGKDNAVIMGRHTWESIPNRPLKDRLNIVISTLVTPTTPVGSFEGPKGSFEEALVFPSLLNALDYLKSRDFAGTAWVIGGARLFNEAMPLCDEIYVTRITSPTFECDTFWSGVDTTRFSLDATYLGGNLRSKSGDEYQMVQYLSKPVETPLSPILVVDHPEYGYLDIVRSVLEKGEVRGDRTGVGTISLFGAQLRFDLSRGFPLLTTKRVFWKGVRDELLWFISGSTDARVLSEKGIHIWDGNGSREFLDSRGLTYPEGILGPVYGYQWRHFGAPYDAAQAANRERVLQKTKGFDQLADVIAQIRTNPTSRRILLTAWDPSALHEMVLPPCHVMCQFYVSNSGKLSSHLYQRSADMGLGKNRSTLKGRMSGTDIGFVGVPFNIASYALLTHLLAHVCGLGVGDFVHSFGDVHIYTNHVDALKEQLTRKPFPFPRLELDPAIGEIDNFTAESIKLVGYECHAAIKMEMAI